MKNLSVIIFLFFLLLASSCVKMEPAFVAEAETCALKLTIPQAGSATRSGALEESVLNETYVLLFDASGHLERREQWEICPSDIVLSNLRRGEKHLCVFVNYNALEGISSGVLDTLTRYSTLEELKVQYSTGSSALSSIPMEYMSDVSLPLSDPQLSIGLKRLFARLSVVDDILEDGFVADSVCFSNLTRSYYPWSTTPEIVPDKSEVLRFTPDTRTGSIYMLPSVGGQISYIAYGRNGLGVTQSYEGRIRPALGSNNSYTLSLLSGELAHAGNIGDFRITVDPSVGSYSETDSVLVLKHRQAGFSLDVSSYDPVGIRTSLDWITVSPNTSTRATEGEYGYSLSFSDYRPEVQSAEDFRRDTIWLYNKLDPRLSKRIFIEQEKAKYYVAVVAGQSNATGMDHSPVHVVHDAPDSRVFQFGQRGVLPPVNKKFTNASTLDIIPLLHQAHTLDGNITNLGKGMNLHLGKQIAQYIPSDYDVLVISVSYTGTGFLRPGALESYDPVTMRNPNFPRVQQLRIGIREGLFYNMLVDRSVHALKLNSKNQFVGVVWSQGESDSNLSSTNDPAACYPLFKQFTQAFFEDINREIAPTQLPENKPADKHLWFPIDCTPGVRKNWHTTSNSYPGSHIFGRYKMWNADTYVPIPVTVSATDGAHFDNNSFATVVIPLVIGRMLHNGVIGDAKSDVPYFVRQISESEAAAQSGSFMDADIQDGLSVCLPFDQAEDVAKNLATSPVDIINNGMTIGSAEELKDINGALRERLVLNLDGSTGSTLSMSSLQLNSWSVSFMFRRARIVDDYSDKFLLRVPGTNIGLSTHQYTKESDGGYLGLVYQPRNPAFSRTHSVVFRLNDASYVRSHEEWIHYAVSYNHLTRVCRMYANGEMIMQMTLPAAADPNITTLVLGDDSIGMSGQLFDLCLWDREVPASTLFKTYIMSYYGITKSAEQP